MRHYEIMLLIHPDQSERARVMMDRYVGIIEGGQGQVHRNEDLGRRMLAYPIAKVHKAHYMLMNVECGQDTLRELVGALHFSDAVLRHLVIRCDEAVSDKSVLARAAEKEAARESREYPYDREIAHERRSKRTGEANGGAKAASDDAPAADDDAPAEDAAATEDESVEAEAAAEDVPAAEDEPAEVEAAAEDAPVEEATAAEDAPAADEAPTEAEAPAEEAPAADDAPAEDAEGESGDEPEASDASGDDAAAGDGEDSKEEKEEKE